MTQGNCYTCVSTELDAKNTETQLEDKADCKPTFPNMTGKGGLVHTVCTVD